MLKKPWITVISIRFGKIIQDQGAAIICVLLGVFMLFIPKYALGEWSGDIYIGIHNSQADDMSIDFNGATVKTVADSDSGSIFGGRIGYWFESYSWLGLALDASVSELNFDDIDIGVGSISTLLMARMALNSSEEFPKGRIQPYLGVGPGFFFGGMSEFIDEVPPAGRVLDDDYFSLGFDGRIGIYYLIKQSVGILLEYGFKRFSPTFNDDVPGGEISLEPTITTHNFLAGISLRF
jgi:hypothetical protein